MDSVVIGGVARGLRGWKREPTDPRDRILPRSVGPLHLPSKVKLDLSKVPVRNQGNLNSCVGHGVGAAYAYLYVKENNSIFDPSEMFIWTVTRQYEGSLGQNEGVYIRDAVKMSSTIGLCGEALWPYDVSKWNVAPPPSAHVDAQKRKAKFYYKVPSLSALKACIAHGLGVVLGSDIFDSIWSNDSFEKTGVMPLPKDGERPDGGHCMYAYGYDDTTQLVRVRNSWGPGFGDNGDAFIPYDYFFRGYISDMWAITNVELG